MKALEQTPWAHQVYLSAADRNSRWHWAKEKTSKFCGLKSCTEGKQPLLLRPGQTPRRGGQWGDERLIPSACGRLCHPSQPSPLNGGLVLMETPLGPPESKGGLNGKTRGFEVDGDQRSHPLLGQTQHPSRGTVTLCFCWRIKHRIYFQRMGCSVQQSHGKVSREGKEKIRSRGNLLNTSLFSQISVSPVDAIAPPTNLTPPTPADLHCYNHQY